MIPIIANGRAHYIKRSTPRVSFFKKIEPVIIEVLCGAYLAYLLAQYLTN